MKTEEPAYKLVRVSPYREIPLTTDQVQALVFWLERSGVDAPVVHQVGVVDGAFLSGGPANL